MKPQEKTKEHVVPRWLIELTGDPQRSAYFGINKQALKSTDPKRSFAFDQFVFPACKGCNESFSTLEPLAKQTLLAILGDKSVHGSAISSLLDWFDKVRVGLWLGMRLLDKNIADVEPTFHIAKRIGQHDRMLITERSDTASCRLNFVGVDTLCFALTPSAFMLIVNDFHFTNVSSLHLSSRRLGFPFSRSSRLLPDRDEVEVEMSSGIGRVMRPVLRRSINERGLIVHQPMFGTSLADRPDELYDCDYVKLHSMDTARGIGNLFLETDSAVSEVGASEVVRFGTVARQSARRLHYLAGINILEWQLWLHTQIPSMELLSSDQRRYVKRRFDTANSLNKVLIRAYRSRLAAMERSPTGPEGVRV
jgi:hypothetical protein